MACGDFSGMEHVDALPWDCYEQLHLDEIYLPSSIYDAGDLYHLDKVAFLAIFNYIKNSLEYGRPLDTTMVVTVGKSGSGKSTTINKLFNDPYLCKTSRFKSETKDVTVVSKMLRVTATIPIIHGFLSLVDTPGTFDSDGDDARNFSQIKCFRQGHHTLASYGRDIDSKMLKAVIKQKAKLIVRRKVYPNVVLFFLAAMTDRIDGKNSDLRKSLNVLKASDLVDTTYPNLIVVVTFAGRIGNTREAFCETFAEMQCIIQKAVFEILSVQNVRIVCIENDGENARLMKDPTTDYYNLPSGELSHFNLLEAIRQCFDRRHDGFEDLLGKLFVGWYANPTCPDKSSKTHSELLEYDPGDIEVAEIAKELERVQILPTDRDHQATNFAFAYLGRGFNPNQGDIKLTNLLEGNTTVKQVEIGNKTCLIPDGVTMFLDTSTKVSTINFEDTLKSNWSINSTLGFKMPIPWFNQFNIGFDLGQWRQNLQENRDTMLMFFTYEKHLARFQMNDPNTVFKCQSFRDHFEGLPKVNKNEYDYDNFFDRWGTHFVTQQCVGGGIYVSYLVNKINSNDNQLQQIEVNLSQYFTNINAGVGVQNNMEQLRSLGVNNEQVHIVGGNMTSTILKFQDLTPEIFTQWNQSISDAPANLVGNSESFPYFLLLTSGKKLQSLKKATLEYLEKQEVTFLQERTQEAISNRLVQEAVMGNQRASASCFPAGTIVNVFDKITSKFQPKRIEDLIQDDTLQTVKSWRKFLGKIGKTKYCTMLHSAPDKLVNFVRLEFANNHTLTVSEDHLIFGYDNHKVQAKPAKNFKTGDQAILVDEDENILITSCLKVSRRWELGVFAPLTCSGTFLANGFFVTSYANVESFSLAQVAMMPLKLWCFCKQIADSDKVCDKGVLKPMNSSSNTANTTDTIHIYAKRLMKIRKLF